MGEAALGVVGEWWRVHHVNGAVKGVSTVYFNLPDM
jgi:hypothetical protein